MGPSSGSFGAGTSGTTVRERCSGASSTREGRSAPGGWGGGGGGGGGGAWASDRGGLSPLTRSRRGDHGGRVPAVDGGGRRRGSGRGGGSAVRFGAGARVADGVRRGHPWDAGAAAAVRALLRALGDRAAAGVSRRGAGTRAELCGVRGRGLPGRARGGVAHAARS